MTTRRQFLQYGLCATASLTLPLLGCSKSKPYSKLPTGSAVTALGDSLTFGYGASEGNDYPTLLAQKTGWRVSNAGVNGNTSADVLQRLDTIVSSSPKLVLLGIGGNDVLRRVQPAQTTDNIRQTLERLQSAGIPVVLIAQPHFSASAVFGRASDNPIYKSIANDKDVPLLAGAWSRILSDDSLKSDQIHANDAGYQRFTEDLYQFLQDIGYA